MLKKPGVAEKAIAWSTAAQDWNMGVGPVLYQLDIGDQLYAKVGNVNGLTLKRFTHLQIFHLYYDD